MPILYQGASVLWFPSFSEGFGLPIVEAMAGGVPVITAHISVMPEIAGDAALYIDPYQPEQLVNETHRLFSDDGLRTELIKKGEVIAARFTWISSVNALLEVYKKLVS